MEERSGEWLRMVEVCMCCSVQAGVLSVLTKHWQLRENWLKRACRAWSYFTMPMKDQVIVKYISRFWFSTVVPHLWWNIWKENLLMNSVLLELTLRKPTGKVTSQVLQMKIFYLWDDLIWLTSVFSLENENSISSFSAAIHTLPVHGKFKMSSLRLLRYQQYIRSQLNWVFEKWTVVSCVASVRPLPWVIGTTQLCLKAVLCGF